MFEEMGLEAQVLVDCPSRLSRSREETQGRSRFQAGERRKSQPRDGEQQEENVIPEDLGGVGEATK